ncbi:GNAT family N-acetyltransferase [Angustibacter peucedani]
MDDVRIVRFDPLTDDELLEGWVDAGMEAGRHEFGEDHTVYSADEVRERNRTSTDRRFVMVAALQGDRVVGEGNVHLSLVDNLTVARSFFSVRPGSRRRGIGSALLAELEAAAREDGRRTMLVSSEVSTAHADPADTFGPAHGYAKALVTLRNDWRLPAGPVDEVLAPVEAEAAPHAADYDLLTWWDGMPEEWLDQRAALQTRMSTDAPLGDIESEEEVWDADRVREQFATVAAMGRRMVTTVAVHRDTGRAVAFTELAVAEHTPDHAYQWDTLVLAEHRGHRLGQLVKAANVRALRAELPAVQRVVTWNAAENAPMLRVNRALGFVTVGVSTDWQKHL